MRWTYVCLVASTASAKAALRGSVRYFGEMQAQRALTNPEGTQQDIMHAYSSHLCLFAVIADTNCELGDFNRSIQKLMRYMHAY
jgi:hypothetical protein